MCSVLYESYVAYIFRCLRILAMQHRYDGYFSINKAYQVESSSARIGFLTLVYPPRQACNLINCIADSKIYVMVTVSKLAI